VVRRRRWCKWSAAAMVIVGRDQTRHYYYNCCTILQLPPPTTAKNPTALGAERSSVATGVGACACAPKSRRGPSCCTPAGTVFESRAGLLAGPPPTLRSLRRSPYAPLGRSARARPRSIHRVGGVRDVEGYVIVGGGRTDPPRTRCARWCVANVVRRVCVCVCVCFGKSAWHHHTGRTHARRGRIESRRPVLLSRLLHRAD